MSKTSFTADMDCAEKLDKPLNLSWGWTIARCCTGRGRCRQAARRAGADIYRRTATFSGGSPWAEWRGATGADAFGQVKATSSIAPPSGSYRYG